MYFSYQQVYFSEMQAINGIRAEDLNGVSISLEPRIT
jgi:hypothetical protein